MYLKLIYFNISSSYSKKSQLSKFVKIISQPNLIKHSINSISLGSCICMYVYRRSYRYLNKANTGLDVLTIVFSLVLYLSTHISEFYHSLVEKNAKREATQFRLQPVFSLNVCRRKFWHSFAVCLGVCTGTVICILPNFQGYRANLAWAQGFRQALYCALKIKSKGDSNLQLVNKDRISEDSLSFPKLCT